MTIQYCQYCAYKTQWVFCSQHHNRRHQYVPYSDCTVPLELCTCLPSTCNSEVNQTENQHSSTQMEPSNIERYQCKFCPHQSRTKSHSRLHVRMKHRNNFDANLPENDWYQCEKRTHKTKLKANSGQHSAEPPFHSDSSVEDGSSTSTTGGMSGKDSVELPFIRNVQARRKRKCSGKKEEHVIRKNEIGETDTNRRDKDNGKNLSSEISSDSATDDDDSVSEPSLKRSKQSPPVQVQTARKDKGKLIRNKRHACYFCQKIVRSPARHLELMHCKELDVEKLLALPKKSRSRRYGLINLTRVGDFYHNSDVLATKKGELILIRRPTEDESMFLTYSDYGPCPHCLGFMQKRHLWHHTRLKCTVRRRGDADLARHVIAESNAILGAVFNNQLSTDFIKHIFSKLRDDEIGNYVKEDDLILKFGAMQFEKYGTTQRELVRQTMRQLGRFTMQMREIENSKNHLTDYLAPQKFDSIIQATKILCASHQNAVNRPECRMPSLALKIGYTLKKCASIKRGICLRTGDLSGNATLIDFVNLMELKWYSRISPSEPPTVRSTRNTNEIQLLPLTSDVIKLSEYIDAETEKFYKCLSESASLKTWTRLASLTLGKVIVFNKTRCGVASRMTLADYLARPMCTQESKNALTDFEKTLAGKTTVVQIINKQGSKVPVLMTQDMKRSVDLLNATRIEVGIDPRNPYLFARRGNSFTHMSGSHCLDQLASDANLKRPDDVSCIDVGTHVAIVCQVLSLNREEYDSLAGYLGREVEVETELCRLRASAEELTKVSRLLMARDKGEVSGFAEKELERRDSEGEEQPEDPRSSSRQPWSAEEKEAVFEFFKVSIKRHTVPGKKDCCRCIQENPVLSSRSWKNVKFCVKNQICKIKRIVQ